ncbi:CLUMA_CG000063, isoform A [Clunio marinus]|uniref:CLUMA_CG000063, isoform A n=1 Tax=Clunio marinus TaxID=568069 RepID=A0A1J1HFD2_9DIPT|nr:CLUMA_CG000063, isoform A [Clunio marinus]
MADKNKSGDFYNRPEKLGAWAGLKQFIWNSDTSQFMGRTKDSWGKILFFYLIFYSVLALFFWVMWLFFASTIVDGHPKYQLKDSLIGDNPGLGFRPMPPSDSNVESTLIWYRKNNATSSKYWVSQIKDFLEDFVEDKSKKDKLNRVSCDIVGPRPVVDICKVNLEKYGKCSYDPSTNKNPNFGFDEGKPCVFLKLNKIFNWIPEYYNNASDLPENMPPQLKKHIIGQKKMKDVVWVSCEGENPADKEHIRELKYYTFDDNAQQGFNGFFYPFNTNQYNQPLVAVRFEDITFGVLINVECKAWAKNIKHDRQERRGSVHFELLIDEN